MNRIRLLPIVVFAAAALLLLKAVGLFSEGGYVLTGTGAVVAESAAPKEHAGTMNTAMAEAGDMAEAGGMGDGGMADGAPLPSAEALAANRASELLFSSAPPAAINSSLVDALPYELNKAGEKVPLAATDGVGDTERAVLERLSDRRSELDQLQRSLDEREALVAAAEARLAERAAGLKQIESQINALVDEKKNLDNEQFTGLVSMYEAMKPKDAARIFDQLSTDVLLKVARAMNPRKMSPVMAAMSPARAQELTALLAQQQAEPQMDKPLPDMASLPQIVGQ